jgi:hypothetical protein
MGWYAIKCDVAIGKCEEESIVSYESSREKLVGRNGWGKNPLPSHFSVCTYGYRYEGGRELGSLPTRFASTPSAAQAPSPGPITGIRFLPLSPREQHLPDGRGWETMREGDQKLTRNKKAHERKLVGFLENSW